MSFLNIVSDLFKPAQELISEFIEDKDKAAELRARMFQIEVEAQNKALEYDKQLLKERASIINTEAKGESWLQRNWRPMMMLWFAALLGMYWFGMTPEGMTQDTINRLFDLLQLGIGGYVVGRSAEKIADKVAPFLKNKGN